MFSSCACPQPAAIGNIGAFTCGENLGQIQKLIFQRRQAADALPFAVNPPAEYDSWEAFFTALGVTKMQITPNFEAFVIPAVEAITEGGDDNTTLDGNSVIVGASQVAVTGNFRMIPASILRALKAYNCEGDLTVYMVNEFSQIIGRSLTNDIVGFQGIPITEWFIGDGGNEGKNTHDKTMFRFNFRYGWRDYLYKVTPTDFDPRFELP